MRSRHRHIARLLDATKEVIMPHLVVWLLEVQLLVDEVLIDTIDHFNLNLLFELVVVEWNLLLFCGIFPHIAVDWRGCRRMRGDLPVLMVVKALRIDQEFILILVLIKYLFVF